MTDKNNFLNILFPAGLVIILLLLLAVESLINLTPPIARDALIHHLAIPKLWILHGGFYDIRWADFSYFPMSINLFYIIPVYVGKDFLANFIHMGFGLGTAVLIYHYLNNRLGRLPGLLGVLIFLCTPIVVRLSTQAYVDLGLCFFTTATILSFIRYRNTGFSEYKWFLISSVCMGIALGTKYNALIIWFFLSLTIVFIYSRDTNNPWKSIQHGAVFFFIALAVFSPWLIKNMMLTGNPLYPLFRSGVGSMVSSGQGIGLFQMRELLYGENFWETLLIPVRMFFQGQDNSPRYFDGVLNPIFIILSPFAFINKSSQRDKQFFAAFTIFFVLMAFFLKGKAFAMDQTIRYALPVLPFLAILTVMGFMNVWNKAANLSQTRRYILLTALLAVLIAAMGKNAVYVKDYYQNIRPTGYLLGKESRDDFIARHVSSYRAMQYINAHTPEDAVVRLIFLAGRGYYLDRIYSEGSSYGIGDVKGLATHAYDEQSFRDYLRSLQSTHILLRKDLFIKSLYDNFPAETVNRLFQQMHKAMELMHEANGYAVYRIIS